MKLISFRRRGTPGFGVVMGEGVVDLSRHMDCRDLGVALRLHGTEALLNIATRNTPDFPLKGEHGIDAYRSVVADPLQIFCVGLNYEEHRAESGRERTARPTIFLRLAGSQVGHEQPLLIPRESGQLDYEGEIAIVIGRGGRRISADLAHRHILGFSCYNDCSVRDWQAHTSQWTAGKNFPSTGAFGPSLTTTDEIGENDVLTLTTRLNGRVMQQTSTSMMIFSIPELLAYISTFTSLEPGDVIVTGTPGGVGFKRTPPVFLSHGDRVEVEVERVGILANTVAREGVGALVPRPAT